MANRKLTDLSDLPLLDDADVGYIVDTSDVTESAQGTSKSFTLSNLKAFLKTHFDTLYQSILVSGTNIKTINGNTLLGSGDLSIGGADYPKVILYANKFDDSIPRATGTTATVKIMDFDIPANTIPENCNLRFTLNGEYSKSANLKSIYLTMNSINVNQGILIAQNNLYTNGNFFTRNTFHRDYFVSDTNIYSGKQPNQYSETSARGFNVTIDRTAINTVNFWVALANAADFYDLLSISVEVIK